MHFDAEAQPELPVPDHVPEDLTEKYGSSARRTVRLSRRRGYPLVRAARRAGAVVLDADLWLMVLMVFAWGVVAAGVLGVLAYAATMLPGAMSLIVLPMVLLLAVSVAVAVGVTRRKDREPQATPY